MTGAIAVIDIDNGNNLHDVWDTPVAGGAVAVPLLQDHLTALQLTGHILGVAIEQVHSMPKQGVSTTFKFGMAYGIVLGFFGANHRVAHVQPTTWKGHFKLNGKDKDVARLRAIERWPNSSDLLKRKKDGGRADAALIGLHFAETAVYA
jgi:crossover junction endodeoxyribonuclease RuvC